MYDDAEWQARSRSFLRRNPTCLDCGAPATVSDHEPPRKELIAQGVPDPDDDAWLQALCKPCHDRKTATVDGGFGRPPSR